jgi:ATP-independent RNA helicase DbpA
LGLSRDDVGKINVNDFSTYVAVRRDLAGDAAARLNAGRIKGKSVKVRLLTGQDTAWT